MRLAIGFIVFVAGCALFSEVPENTCRSNADCFQAQGETCNMETKKCEPPPDAAVPVDAAAVDEEAP